MSKTYRGAIRLGLWAGLTLTALSAFPAFAAAQAASRPDANRPPLAQSLTGEALTNFESALLLYRDNDFAGAQLKFRRAFELSHDPRLLWNMAACEKNQRHYARVEQLLRQYVAAPQTTEGERGEAKVLLDTIGDFIGSVAIDVDQPGADVFVDDVHVGQSPLPAPVRLDMGTRAVRVVKSGFRGYAAPVELTGGATTHISVRLAAEPREGKLRVSAAPGATIRVDGVPVGNGTWEGNLATGPHQIEVTSEGIKPWRSEAVIQTGQLTSVLVSQANNAAPAPSAGMKVIPAWAWVAGSAVLATGLGVG
ncbi:MAG TPA: PEGA domain-containing protein, partial [Polyangiaceae bacterium]|nr:PEGA domain-containing protein [Polyangiaceae bacterium]